VSVKKPRERERAQNVGIIGGLCAVVIVALAFFGLWLSTGWAWNVWTWLQMLVLAVTLGLVVYGFVLALLAGSGSSPGRSKNKPDDGN
jgi:hypothetical protein